MHESPIEPHKLDFPDSALPETPRSNLRLVLDQVRSAHNTGAIFRTADAAAVEWLYLVGVTPHPPHPQLEKTALGATRYVPWKHRPEFGSILRELERDEFTPVALDNGPGAVGLWNFEWPRKTALVAGNEVDGISPEVLECCPLRVTVPMFGIKRSLNVTTALGIAMYHFLESTLRQP